MTDCTARMVSRMRDVLRRVQDGSVGIGRAPNQQVGSALRVLVDRAQPRPLSHRVHANPTG